MSLQFTLDVARFKTKGTYLDAVGLLDGEHFPVLLGGCDGHSAAVVNPVPGVEGFRKTVAEDGQLQRAGVVGEVEQTERRKLQRCRDSNTSHKRTTTDQTSGPFRRKIRKRQNFVSVCRAESTPLPPGTGSEWNGQPARPVICLNTRCRATRRPLHAAITTLSPSPSDTRRSVSFLSLSVSTYSSPHR